MKEENSILSELTELERKGTTLWVSGVRRNSNQVADTLCVKEDGMYMRDYVYDKGVLKELRFDKVL